MSTAAVVIGAWRARYKQKFVSLKYSHLSLSRLRLSQITAYLEVKIWSLLNMKI